MCVDQCAVYELSKQNETGARFRDFFGTREELLLSSINLFELGQLRSELGSAEAS